MCCSVRCRQARHRFLRTAGLPQGRKTLADWNKVLPSAAIRPWCGQRGPSSLRLWSDRHHGGSISVDAWRVSSREVAVPLHLHALERRKGQCR